MVHFKYAHWMAANIMDADGTHYNVNTKKINTKNMYGKLSRGERPVC